MYNVKGQPNWFNWLFLLTKIICLNFILSVFKLLWTKIKYTYVNLVQMLVRWSTKHKEINLSILITTLAFPHYSYDSMNSFYIYLNCWSHSHPNTLKQLEINHFLLNIKFLSLAKWNVQCLVRNWLCFMENVEVSMIISNTSLNYPSLQIFNSTFIMQVHITTL